MKYFIRKQGLMDSKGIFILAVEDSEAARRSATLDGVVHQILEPSDPEGRVYVGRGYEARRSYMEPWSPVLEGL